MITHRYTCEIVLMKLVTTTRQGSEIDTPRAES
jgi:hypothetical protein